LAARNLDLLPGYFAKMIRRGGYREKFGQRVGIYDGEVRNRLSNQRPTWLHAVSVGEVNIALKLANALRALEPDLHCVLTQPQRPVRVGAQNCAALDRSHVHAAGLLANHVPCVFRYSSRADCSC